MLKATLAVKVAAGVLGGILVTGGGIALASDTFSTSDQPLVSDSVQPDGQPGASCADDQDGPGEKGAQGPNADPSAEADQHDEADAQGEADEQGEDCGQSGDEGSATEGPEGGQSDGPNADQTGDADHHGEHNPTPAATSRD